MTSPTTLYVSRTLDRPADELALAMDQLSGEIVRNGVALRLGAGRPTRPPVSATDPWRSIPARLRCRLRPAFAVSLEVMAWSDDRSQLGIRPESRRCSWWAESFCEAAHAALDEIGFELGITRVLVPPLGERRYVVDAIDADERVATVSVAGDLDYKTGEQLRDEMFEPFDAGAQHLRVDLAGLRSVDSAGLAVFVLLTHTAECQRRDATVTLTSVPEPIRETIDVTGFGELLTVE
jgi:anti-anti-sigma factor